MKAIRLSTGTGADNAGGGGRATNLQIALGASGIEIHHALIGSA